MSYKPYLATLRRIPEPIILAMATREMELSSANACMVGWALREHLAYANGKAAENYRADEALVRNVPCSCGDPTCMQEEEYESAAVRLFGGTKRAWRGIFEGVMDRRMPDIEHAFVRRVMECVK